MAGEYGPIFKLATPGGIRLFLSGPELVDEVCDDARFDKKVGGGLANLQRGELSAGLFTAEHRRPAVAPGAQHPHVAVQPAVDARLHAQDARHRRPADGQVVAAQPGRGGRRPRGHDPADARHDRAVRLRLPVQLLLPRHPAPVRRGDDAHPRRVPGPGPAAADPDPAPHPRAAADGGGRGVHERPGRTGSSPSAAPRSRVRPATPSTPATCSAGCSPGVDKQTGEKLPDENIRAQCITFLVAGHETTSGLLSFAIYYLIKNPAFADRARAEVDAVLGATAAPTFEQVQRLTYVRQVLDESAAAVADRARLHPRTPTRTP